MIREFNDTDYDLFAGARHFECGGDPLIDDQAIPGHTVICGSETVEVFTNDVETSYGYPVAFPTQAGARLFLQGIIATLHGDDITGQLENLGFETTQLF